MICDRNNPKWSVEPLGIPDVLLYTPHMTRDERGYAGTLCNLRHFHVEGMIDDEFVQEFVSYSRTNTIRGLHYQIRKPQGKLIYIFHGQILDVAVDLRRPSDTFGKHVRYVLTKGQMIWIPPGFAHGFKALEDVDMQYLFTEYTYPELTRVLLWNDPDLKIEWNITAPPILSEKDEAGKRLRDSETFT